MRRTLLAVMVCLIVLGSFLGTSLAYSVKVSNETPRGNAYIPKGTLIEAELITGANSGDNGVDDVVYFKLRQNVIINGVVVLASGTIGSALVTKAEAADFLGKPGKLELQANPVPARNGALVPLTLDIKKYGGFADKDLAYQLVSLYSLGSHKMGWLYSGFRGGEADIPAGLKFQVAVDYDADLGCAPERLAVVMIR